MFRFLFLFLFFKKGEDAQRTKTALVRVCPPREAPPPQGDGGRRPAPASSSPLGVGGALLPLLPKGCLSDRPTERDFASWEPLKEPEAPAESGMTAGSRSSRPWPCSSFGDKYTDYEMGRRKKERSPAKTICTASEINKLKNKAKRMRFLRITLEIKPWRRSSSGIGRLPRRGPRLAQTGHRTEDASRFHR